MDTRIIGDVSLGFEKAARHGIAVAPAPNYNLGEYFGFAGIMAAIGERAADQIMYNAGVIFFQPRSTARQVLERWRDLCAKVGAASDFPHDQPFLTLAMDQLGFLPYVLSPLYNYRNLGEPAVGRVRLWHSHLPVPDDVNVFKHAWPARRFKNGLRLEPDSEPADVPARVPEGMMRLTTLEMSRRQTPKAAQRLEEEMRALQRNGGSRNANEAILRRIGLSSVGRDEAYFAEALHYHLAQVHAYGKDPERMAWHMALSRTMPTNEDDQIFSDHVNVSHVLRGVQERAVARGIPPILISCMPRSASATLAYSLAHAMGIPVFHVSVGCFPGYYLAPSWLDMFLEGGAITQDHFGPSEFNLGVLRSRDIRSLFVLVRDPRAAARSQVHYLAEQPDAKAEPLASHIEREVRDNFVPWLQGWIDCSKRPDLPFRIHWLMYRDVRGDLAGVLQSIGCALAPQYPAMAAYAQRRTIPETRMHFVTGSDDAWRAEVDDATRERLWEACGVEIRSLLDLQP